MAVFPDELRRKVKAALEKFDTEVVAVEKQVSAAQIMGTDPEPFRKTLRDLKQQAARIRLGIDIE